MFASVVKFWSCTTIVRLHNLCISAPLLLKLSLATVYLERRCCKPFILCVPCILLLTLVTFQCLFDVVQRGGCSLWNQAAPEPKPVVDSHCKVGSQYVYTRAILGRHLQIRGTSLLLSLSSLRPPAGRSCLDCTTCGSLTPLKH